MKRANVLPIPQVSAVFLSAGFSMVAVAQPPDPQRLLIHLVEGGAEIAAVSVEGERFLQRMSETRVMLDGAMLAVAAVPGDARRLHARLPAKLGDGAYRLRVAHAARPDEWVEVPVILGVVGPIVQDD